MAYVSLYRKYRPDTFDKVIGQEHIVRTLSNQIKSGSIAHAYLFTGTRGTGKTSVARIFAKAVNCLNPQNGSPCGECTQCKELSDPNHIDILEIDAASNNSVDDIRELREKVSYAPSKTKYKVYIIDEVHQLSPSAFNALLKTLEEPPSYVMLSAATTEIHKLPQTIISRCIKFDFRLVPVELIARHIKNIFDMESVQYSSDALLAIARSGEGSVRDALSVADMCLSYSESDITYEKVLEVLGANDPSLVADIVRGMLYGDLATALNSLELSASLGRSVPVLARDITKLLRDLLIVKAENRPNEILKLPDKVFELVLGIATNFDSMKILRALEIFSNADTMMKYSAFPRIVLETAIFKAATLEGGESLDLLVKLNEIERKLAATPIAVKSTVIDSHATTNYQTAPQKKVVVTADTAKKAPAPKSEANNTAKDKQKANNTVLDKSEAVGDIDKTLSEVNKSNVAKNQSQSVTHDKIVTDSDDKAVTDKAVSNIDDKAVTDKTILSTDDKMLTDKTISSTDDKADSGLLDIPTATDAATELIATELIELVELDSVPKDWEFDAPQNESQTDEMIKLKGNIVKTLRKKNKVVLSIMIGDSADISIEGNVITFSVASESDLDFIRLNIAILKEAADELLSGDYNIKLERLAASGEDELKKIVDLFSPSAVIIKNN